MSSSGQRTHLKLLTVGDFDPQMDRAIEYDFIGRVIAGRVPPDRFSRSVCSRHAAVAQPAFVLEPEDFSDSSHSVALHAAR
jgi:hypothetical protein